MRPFLPLCSARLRPLAAASLALAAALAASPASAAVKYLATWGNDSNPGTSASPYKTFQKAVRSVGEYDEIRVYPGTFYTADDINVIQGGRIRCNDYGNKPNVVFTAPQGLNDSKEVNLFHDWFTWEGINIKGGGQGIDMGGRKGIKIKYSRFENSYQAAIRFRFCNDVLVEDCDFTNNGLINADRTGAQVGNESWPHIILGENSNNVRITRNRIYKNHGEGVGPYLNCRDWRIDRNEISDNWSVNLYLDTSADDAAMVVERNLIYNTGWRANGNPASKPRGILIANEQNTTGGWETRNVTIRNNVILACGGGIEAIRFNWSGNQFQLKNSRIVNNTIVGTTDNRWGVWVSHGTGNTIRNNIVRYTHGLSEPGNNDVGDNRYDDPRFAKGDANGWNSKNANDYKLRGDSNCRDAGSANAYGVNEDHFGTGRVRNGRIDIGAHEF